MKVIIPCGSKKAAVRCAAADLYLGGYFTALRDWALSVASRDDVLIISAKHGFVRLDDVLDPYNVRFGMAAAVSARILADQTDVLRLSTDDVWIIAGTDYVLRVKSAVPRARSVFSEARHEMGGRGIGYQRQWAIANHGRLPGAKRTGAPKSAR